MKLKNSFKLLNIILIESFFRREPKIDFQNSNLKTDINIDIQNTIEKNTLFVTLVLDFKSSLEEQRNIEAKIKMLGIFEFEEKSSLPIESFGTINAPAIIFPYIREHLSNVSIKAGIHPILLPPVNFVRLAEEKKKDNSLQPKL